MKTNIETKSRAGSLSSSHFTRVIGSLALAAALLAGTQSALAANDWTGAQDGTTWDVNITPNWSQTVFLNGDAVSFDNTVSAVNRTISVAAGGVAPLSILVNNSFGSADYIFIGGAITGAGFLTKIGSGSLQIGCVQSYAGLTTNAGLTMLCSPLPNAAITNNAGSELLFCENNTGSAVTVNGSTKIYASQTLVSLAIGSTGVVRDATSPMNWDRMIDTQALSIASGGILDLTNNGIVVRGGSLSLITSEIASGLTDGLDGYWDGPGINSSCAAEEPNGLTAVGVIDNAIFGYTAFSNVTGLTGNEIIAAYTLYGDADLNGLVDGTDLALFNLGFSGAEAALWQYGDFDYNGSVNNDDYTLFLTGFNGQGAVQACTPEFPPACVPEPSTAAMLAAGAASLLGFRRRSCKAK